MKQLLTTYTLVKFLEVDQLYGKHLFKLVRVQMNLLYRKQ